MLTFYVCLEELSNLIAILSSNKEEIAEFVISFCSIHVEDLLSKLKSC